MLNEKNVMLDLETLGTDEDAVFISIGAVCFEPYTGKITNEFYRRISWQSGIDAGRSVTEATLKWWMKQSPDALGEVLKSGGNLSRALSDFIEWFPKDHDIWGNGATFDISMVRHAMRTNGFKVPWAYWAERDVRTIRDLAPNEIDFSLFEGTPHHALHDAIFQASYVCQMAQDLGANNVPR